MITACFRDSGDLYQRGRGSKTLGDEDEGITDGLGKFEIVWEYMLRGKAVIWHGLQVM